ncbi:TetR/AcrR family transcriptional regulator [Agromyces aurantiacus]|uniref:TetR/AcrR family transcriptional regulator n=1 Tax=Agromyces aurantiacus TaxID=165814 RepID=A0ABV9R8R7_9MICO|nr:TetR/AcrR family transcriptional regulator [Agromyces aurantiacus]MBM7504370.1 AcrR family transcriptional regulator [Agromyces aurantiacus]
MTPRTTRIPADERREQILDAATAVFGEYGYVAATTDRVARAAGISQPYVVRLFGTKEQLFVETLRHTLGRLLATFRGALPEAVPEGDVEVERLLGAAYVRLVEDRGVLLTLMHGFLMGSDPVIGPVARRGFLQVFRMLRDEARFSPEQVHRFLADGMLINTLLASGLGLAAKGDPDAAQLLDCTTSADVLDALERASA